MNYKIKQATVLDSEFFIVGESPEDALANLLDRPLICPYRAKSEVVSRIITTIESLDGSQGQSVNLDVLRRKNHD